MIRNHCIIKRSDHSRPEPDDRHESAGMVLLYDERALGPRLWRSDERPEKHAVMDTLPRIDLHVCKFCGCVYALDREDEKEDG